MGEVTELLAEARHEMTIFNRPSKRTSLRMIEALTTAQAEMEALRAEVKALRAALEQIAQRDGDGFHMHTPQAMEFIALKALSGSQT